MIQLIVVLIIVGALLYIAERSPIDGTIKMVIRVIVLIAVLFFVLQAFGLLTGLDLPRIHS